MKLATWNVNSIRQRLPHVLDWLNANEPDVLALQEIKTEADKFPLAEIEASGYRCVLSGQKAYNGVALISRDGAADVVVDIPDFADEQRRVIAASYGDTRVINVYVPNGQSVGSDKYRYKLDWLNALYGWLEGELKKYPRLAIVGDFNIAPEDRDVHDPELWRDQVLCSGPGTRAARGAAKTWTGGYLPAFRAAGKVVFVVGLPGDGLQAQPRAAHRPHPGVQGAGGGLQRNHHRHAAAQAGKAV